MLRCMVCCASFLQHIYLILLSQEQMLSVARTLDLVQALYYWTMLTALEMKQTSHNASTMGWVFTTVCPVKMLVFSVMQVNNTWGRNVA